MIRGICTGWHVDPVELNRLAHLNWPTVFSEVPRVGDYVRSQQGPELRVGAITHLFANEHAEARVEVYLEP